MKSIRIALLYQMVGALAGFAFIPGAVAQQDVITTIAGSGPNDIPAANANLNTPQQLAMDKQGNYYFANFGANNPNGENRVFKVSPAGIITVVAGAGAPGYSGDGGPAIAAELYRPQGVAVDNANPANVYIADSGNCLVRKVTGSTGIITTIAGYIYHPASGAPYPVCGYAGDGGAADAGHLYDPVSIAVNPSNNDVYIAEYDNGRVRKIAGGVPTGTISTVAGGGGSTTNSNNCQGSAPYGDGAEASQSFLCSPAGVAIDASVSPANVFISDSGHQVIREIVGSSGKIYQIAGTYNVGGFLDGVAANTARFNFPYQLVVLDSSAKTTVTVSDYYNNRIRQFQVTLSAGVPTPGLINTIAGDGNGYSGDGGLATNAGISNPIGIVFDSAGNLYIADSSNRIRKVTKSSGFISTVAGWGTSYTAQTNYSDPVEITNVPGTGLSLYQPVGVYFDPESSKLYVGGNSSQNVYVLNTTNVEANNFAGNGIAGFAGYGTAATASGVELNNPEGLAKDSSGNIYIADSANCVIRQVNASTGIISTFAGTPNRCGNSGDGGAAISADLNGPAGVAIDANNNLFIADYYNCVIREVNGSTHIITTYAGTGTCGYNGDGQPATIAELSRPQALALDGNGNLFIADQFNHRIRKVDASFGFISTVAGDGVAGYANNPAATASSLYYPAGVAADANGNLFISDTDNDLLRWVDPAGNMVTFAGTADSNGSGGDGGLATSAMLYYPEGIAQDNAGNFYFADYNNDRIRKITAFAGYGRSTSQLAFDKQGVGTTSEFQPVILSAIGPVTIDSVTSTAGFAEYDDCAGAELTAGQTCEIDVYFSPQQVGKTKGTLTIASNSFFAGQGNTIDLYGTGAGLSFSGSLAFGPQTVGTQSTQTITVSNSGSPVTLLPLTLAAAGAYSITGGSCPLAGGLLAGSSSCTIIVTFAPKAIGFAKDTLEILNSSAVPPLIVPVTGTGVGFTISSTNLSFGSLVFGSSKVLPITITNASSTALTLATSIIGPGASAFSVISTGNTCGTSVPGNKSCILPVQFEPATVGNFGATLTVTTNGGANPSISLTGSDTAAVSISPLSQTFSSVIVGNTSIMPLIVSNLGSRTLTVSWAITGTNASTFTVLTSGNTCTSGVPVGKTCSLPIQFAPKAIGNYSVTLTLTTNGGANPAIPLSGSGAATVTASPNPLAFGTITLGTTSTMNVTVTNNGASTIGIGSSISTSAPFTELFNSANTCGDGVPPTKSCTLPIQFAPTAAGSFTANLTINAGTTTLIVNLTGTGK